MLGNTIEGANCDERMMGWNVWSRTLQACRNLGAAAALRARTAAVRSIV
jgi:hypothetical protein